MQNFGEILRKHRLEKKLPLRTVAKALEMDQAILSKIERGLRSATREQVIRFAQFFQTDENELIINWLSDKLIYAIEDEDNGLKALQLAEEKVAYVAFKKIDRNVILENIKKGIKQFPQIEKAWIYGSFARMDDGPNSDVDIALQTGSGFNYFDLAEVQFQIEKLIMRKVDVGFIDSFKPYIFENVKPDLKLIYEKPSY